MQSWGFVISNSHFNVSLFLLFLVPPSVRLYFHTAIQVVLSAPCGISTGSALGLSPRQWQRTQDHKSAKIVWGGRNFLLLSLQPSREGVTV